MEHSDAGRPVESAPTPTNTDIPPGLVGERLNDTCFIDGIPFPCLLDSGSQVTVISMSVFEELKRRMFPLSDLILWHGGGGKIPYAGWTNIDLGLQESFAGTPRSFNTLALIVPDHPQAPYRVVIGTNTGLFDHLRKTCRKTAGTRYLQKLPIHSWCASIYKDAETTQKLGPNGRLGPVRSKCALHLLPGETKTVQCYLRNLFGTSKTVLIDAPRVPRRPGLIPAAYVTDIDGTSICKVLLKITNISDFDISLPADTQLADAMIPNLVSPTISGDRGLQAASCSVNVSTTSEEFQVKDLPFQWGPETPPASKERILKEFQERSIGFPRHKWDFGLTDRSEHELNLNDDSGFRERPRRVPPGDLKDLRDHIQALLDHGIIRESKSRYASPIVLVRKKDGSLRMCVDYRILNSRTITDQYAVPVIQDAIDCLAGSSWFSVIDLKSGFYQIPMKEEDKEKTAFTCPVGFFEFERMPQGIKGAPSTFQRLMEKCLSGMNFFETLVYMDDLIIFAKSPEEMEDRLIKVMDRLVEFGLKVAPEKCQLFCRSVKYLGHIVSEEGVSTDPEKISAITSWPTPRTAKELRSFLGLCGYYRRFIEGYAKIANPLHALLSHYGYSPKRGRTRKKQRKQAKKTRSASEPFANMWTDECSSAFQTLKDRMSSSPVLSYADFDKPFVLHTDASRDGLGAVLCQEHQGKMKPVAYASKSLCQSERNYPAHKLEFLALKWAVTDRFKDYMYHSKDTTVMTDNNPLTYVLTSAKLDATGHRWLASLANYDFTIRYKPGNTNQDADALSRRPTDIDLEAGDLIDQRQKKELLRARLADPTNDQICTKDVMDAIYDIHQVTSSRRSDTNHNNVDVNGELNPYAYSLGIAASAVPIEYDVNGAVLNSHDWEKEQMEDPILKRLKLAVISKQKPHPTEEDPLEFKTYSARVSEA